jgi:hypothetical protein
MKTGIPGINWMDIPERRVKKDYIRYQNITGMHELYQTRPCITKTSSPPHIPPYLTLSIYYPLIT